MFYPTIRRRSHSNHDCRSAAADFDRVINRLFASESGSPVGWAPAVDLTESSDDFRLTIDLPGLAPADVDVSIDQGVLAITGNRVAEKIGDDAKQHVAERRRGSFKRAFNLPDLVDPDAVAGKFRNGVLELTLPKRPRAKPKKVEVALGS